MLEKAESGAKRILSSMVSDTLALAKKAPARTIKVLVGALVPTLGEAIELWLRYKFEGSATVSSTNAEDVDSLLDHASTQHFNICFIELCARFPGRGATGEELWEQAITLVKALKSRGVKGVIVSSFYGFPDEGFRERICRAGATYLWDEPYAVEGFFQGVDKCLNPAGSLNIPDDKNHEQ